MDNLKKFFRNKKAVILIIIAVLLVGGVSGYFIYDNNRKNEIMEKMSITFTDTKEVEYGTKNFDVQKELVKEVKDAELTEIPKLDTTKIGEVTLIFTLKKSDVTKTIEHKVKIVDTKGPEIVLEADNNELTVGDEYDIKTNITSVKDPVDGDISLNEDASEINKKATEEYTEIKKDEIAFKDVNGEAKFADHKLDDFFIETTKGEDEKETNTLYLKNCYYIDGNVDTATAGEYKTNVIAVDKNGVKSTKEFTVTVKEKEVEKPVASNGGGSSSGGNASVSRGSKQDIINTALAQVGKPYQSGATGPDAFDCSGLIYYAFTQNGWSIPRYPESGGTRVSYDQVQAGDIVWIPSINHVMLIIGKNANGLSAVGANNMVNVSTTGAPAQAIQANPNKYIFIRY